MKRLFALLAMAMLSMSTFTQVSAQDSTHMTKSGKLDKRYNANKHLTKGGKMDMRYKSSKSAVSKVEAQKKKPVKP